MLGRLPFDSGLVGPRAGSRARLPAIGVDVQLFDRVPIRAIPPNLITATGMVIGILSVFRSSSGDFETAAWFIALAALLDKLDGSVARRLGGSSPFGVQFDSFSDFVTFGMAPAAFCYYVALALAPLHWGRAAPLMAGFVSPHLLLICICALYVVCAAVRLAKFNIITDENPGWFEGLPSTLSGSLVALLFLAALELGITGPRVPGLLPAVMLANTALMVCKLPLPKLRLWRHPALKAFQIANAVAVYVLVPARLLFWYPLLILILYVLVGFIHGVRTQGGRAVSVSG